MNKSFRQGQILQIVRSKGIYTQDELARELGERGVQTTQVTFHATCVKLVWSKRRMAIGS